MRHLIRSPIGRRRSLGTSHFQLGNALVRAGRNREAAQECRKAVEILRPLGEPDGIAYNARRTLMIGYAYLAEALEPEIEKDAAARPPFAISERPPERSRAQ